MTRGDIVGIIVDGLNVLALKFPYDYAVMHGIHVG